MANEAMARGKLLFDEHPLVILPELATAVGLHAAIVVQQLHYWLRKSTNVRDGRTWVYNSIPEWRQQMPFLTECQIRDALTLLRKSDLIITA